MVHPRGFEPLTTRFVAEYSIQLSYGCKSKIKKVKKMVHPRGFEPLTTRFVAEYSIQLSYGCKSKIKKVKKMVHPRGFEPLTTRFVAEYSIQLSYGCTGAMAVREGFEPSMRLLTACSLSRGVPSASRPPHRCGGRYYCAGKISQTIFLCDLLIRTGSEQIYSFYIK